jgi:predicted HTH domain antitoxin
LGGLFRLVNVIKPPRWEPFQFSTKNGIPSAGLTEKECLVELAVHLYAERRLAFAQALRLAGLNRLEFEEELARREISVYSVEDLEHDVAALKELGRL